MQKIHLDNSIEGSILDIGGGGEGIMGRIYQSQLIAVDNRQEELDEAPVGFVKQLMDARKLDFAPESFDNVSFFYTFMYIDKADHESVFKEAIRVLRKQGSLYIWDSRISEADPFIIDLEIDAAGQTVRTSYGIYKDDAAQDEKYFVELAQRLGLGLAEQRTEAGQFYLHLLK